MKKIPKIQKGPVLHPLIITINLMVLLLFGNAIGIGSSSRAENAPATEGIITQAEGTKESVNAVTSQVCVYKLTKYADPEFESYKSFMEDNFKNKSSTSSLLDLGIQRYDQFKRSITDKLSVLMSGQLQAAANSYASNAIQYSGLSDCEAKAAEYINNASKLLQMRAFATSSIKKTSIFVEKYKQINSKLRSLDLDIMKMVVNIRSFEEKLPCYLKTCI